MPCPVSYTHLDVYKRQSYDFAVSGFVIGALVRGLSILARLLGIGIGYLLMLVPGSPSLLIVGISVSYTHLETKKSLRVEKRSMRNPVMGTMIPLTSM